jgi:hypothetical protein
MNIAIDIRNNPLARSETRKTPKIPFAETRDLLLIVTLHGLSFVGRPFECLLCLGIDEVWYGRVVYAHDTSASPATPWSLLGLVLPSHGWWLYGGVWCGCHV